MSEVKDYGCLAAHLFYNEPWEALLVEGVLPYVETTLKTGIAQQYFFIRYWERGPHLRLRFFGETSLLRDVLQANLREHFQSYFNSKPSKRIEPNYPERVPEEYRWKANNSIYFVAYEPELERYGGEQGMALSERHFFHSSRIVLQNLENKAGRWTYEDALGVAIKLHLSFAHAVGMDLATATAFFHFIFYNWLPRSFQFQRQKNKSAAIREQSRETLQAFEEAFDSQRSALLSFHQSLWQALETQQEFEEAGLNEWIAENRQTSALLKEAQQQRQLQPRPLKHQYTTKTRIPLTSLQKQLWMQYADYLHMTNNRLGILNRDEGYLAYLMMKSLEAGDF